MASSRQLAAIMFTDIVGYTSLMGEDEEQAFAILSINRQLQKPIISKYSGRCIKELGDGILACFTTVSDAVKAALEIQQACRAQQEFSLRIGIHLGEVVFEEGDVFGDGVNIASRLQALAPEGGIWVSEAVYHNIVNKKEISTRFVREEALKNVKDPVRVYEIVQEYAVVKLPQYQEHTLTSRKVRVSAPKKRKLLLVAGIILFGLVIGFSYWLFANRSTKQIQSIAVLPFVNETKNKDLEFLSDGMTETLIRSLSQLPGLNVKARSSVFRYKGKEADVPTIGKDLNVQAVLNGRVVQRAGEWVLYLELVDARNNNQLWGEEYHRQAADLVLLQSEIARDVSEKLRVELSGAEAQKLVKSYTTNAEAYQVYLKGRFYWNKRTPEALKKAIGYFQQAIDLDSNYALAYSGLADAYSVYFDYDRGYPPENTAKGKVAALKALALDEGLAEAHASLGQIYLNSYDLREADREFKRAIQLNPNYATAHHWYGLLLLDLGKIEEALAEHRRALEIDPLSAVINLAYAADFFYARKYDESIALTQKVLELDPNNPAAVGHIGICYVMKQDYAQAVEHFAKSRELTKDSTGAKIVREAFAKGGWQGFLQSRLKDARVSASPLGLARIYSALGNKEEAMAQLNQSFKRREIALLRTKVDPRLDPLRTDPRFQELLRRIGLE